MAKVTAEDMVKKYQAETEFASLATVLNAIKIRQKNKFTDHYWSKQFIRDETIKELEEMNFIVEDYEDVHSEMPMIRISWEHLVGQ